MNTESKVSSPDMIGKLPVVGLLTYSTFTCIFISLTDFEEFLGYKIKFVAPQFNNNRFPSSKPQQIVGGKKL